MANKKKITPAATFKEEEDWLDCILTNAEIQDKGEQLAKLEQKLAQNTSAKKAAMADYKRTEDGIASEINSLSHQINTKKENRLVKVKVTTDYAAKVLRKIRLDTGEQIFVRPLKQSELQPNFLAEDDDDDD